MHGPYVAAAFRLAAVPSALAGNPGASGIRIGVAISSTEFPDGVVKLHYAVGR